MKIARNFAFFILGVGMLAGCAGRSSVIVPEITFSHMQPYQLNISQIAVEERFTPSQSSPRIELRMKQPPIQVLRRWASDRLAASNVSVGGTARFIIIDAGVTEQALDTDGNFTAYFTNEQALRYEASVEAVIELQSANGMSKGNAKARVVRAVTVPEKASVNEREQALFNLIEKLMKEFDARMDESIRAHLSTWLQ
ncbi:MAG: hypothetical protein HON65_10820 [Rhodospirillales bacterium]|nr:hypothetical protein [Rhodospirillales bacterium]